MKNVVISIFVGLISLQIQAQKVIEKTIAHKGRYIDLDVKFASDIKVETWDKNEVYFKAIIDTKEGKFQEYYKLDIDESSNKISITSEAEGIFKKFQEEWNRNHPNKKERYYNTGDWYEFKYVLYVPKKARFKVSSINGDLSSKRIVGEFEADLINGDIEIATYTGNLDLSTINGEIDLHMVNTSLRAETIHGDIYADEELDFKTTNRHVGQTISGSTANATNSLRLNTINGNMYLRL